MPLIKEMEDVLKLFGDVPERQQKMGAKILARLVLSHEESQTMTFAEQNQLFRLRSEGTHKRIQERDAAFKKNWRKYL